MRGFKVFWDKPYFFRRMVIRALDYRPDDQLGLRLHVHDLDYPGLYSFWLVADARQFWSWMGRHAAIPALHDLRQVITAHPQRPVRMDERLLMTFYAGPIWLFGGQADAVHLMAMPEYRDEEIGEWVFGMTGAVYGRSQRRLTDVAWDFHVLALQEGHDNPRMWEMLEGVFRAAQHPSLDLIAGQHEQRLAGAIDDFLRSARHWRSTRAEQLKEELSAFMAGVKAGLQGT